MNFDNMTKLNLLIGCLTTFTSNLEKSYRAELFNSKVINCNFIIKQEGVNLYKSYLDFTNILDLLQANIYEENNISVINIKSQDFPVFYELKIYLDNYLIQIPKIKIHSDFCFSLDNDKSNSKANFKILINKNFKVFNIIRTGISQ